MLPDLLHRSHVVSSQFADVLVAARHVFEHAIAAAAACAFRQGDFTRREVHARLAQGRDQQTGRRVVAHRLPVLTALGARTNGDRLAELHLVDVGSVSRHTGLRID